jgi:hypothetical protein
MIGDLKQKNIYYLLFFHSFMLVKQLGNKDYYPEVYAWSIATLLP